MRRITEIKEYRRIQMDILDVIDRYCKENNIVYSIGYGTLLGAVRHKGYIPWDDDIDIIMPRKDYSKFVNGFGIQEEHYELIDYRNRTPYIHTFIKVIDTNTIGFEEGGNIPDLGVWVDVFPIDYASNNKSVRQSFVFIKRFFSMLIQFGYKGGGKTLKHHFCRLFPIKYNKRHQLYEKITSLWSDTDWMSDLSSGTIEDFSFPKECFANTIDMQFEDRVYKSLVGWDLYLKYNYGDYMKLPPIEERTTHNFVAYIK